jgi:hypothetical protein
MEYGRELGMFAKMEKSPGFAERHESLLGGEFTWVTLSFS